VTLGGIQLFTPSTSPPFRAGRRTGRLRSVPGFMARSNLVKLPTICIIIRPIGVIVSMFSVSERRPALVSAIRSMMCSTSFAFVR
jgi:hypothetical protein